MRSILTWAWGRTWASGQGRSDSRLMNTRAVGSAIGRTTSADARLGRISSTKRGCGARGPRKPRRCGGASMGDAAASLFPPVPSAQRPPTELLSRGAQVNAANSAGLTPLMLATERDLLSHSILKPIILLRQARDKHRKKLRNCRRFLQVHAKAWIYS